MQSPEWTAVEGLRLVRDTEALPGYINFGDDDGIETKRIVFLRVQAFGPGELSEDSVIGRDDDGEEFAFVIQDPASAIGLGEALVAAGRRAGTF